MSKTGVTNLPLHGGKVPRWLFKRMVKLSKGIIDVLILEFGRDEFIRRMSDPFWFQALSCVLGFDYHSSGTTTVTCGALSEALKPFDEGIAVAGGKGKASRKTLYQIENIGDDYNLSTAKIDELKYSSRMTAKIDNAAIQDGYNLYHHVFIFSESGLWCVIQQGLNSDINYARRYHWLSENISSFINEPHNGIISDKKSDIVLDMTSINSKNTQKICVDLIRDNPRHLMRDWMIISNNSNQFSLDNWIDSSIKFKKVECLNMPRTINWNKMKELYDYQPSNYEELLSIKGVGQKTVRALSLISELIYGEKPSWNDPVKYTFTVGGKDGVPYPVDKKSMDESSEIIKDGINKAKIGNRDKLNAIRRLHRFIPTNSIEKSN
jgi:hypothetical protein